MLDSTQEKLNKLTKFFWIPCIMNDQVDLSLVEGSDDFSCIPKTRGGNVEVQIGELRDIVKQAYAQGVVDASFKLAVDREFADLERVNAFCFYLIGQCLEANATTMKISQEKVVHKGDPVGDWEIVVKKKDG